jgi:polyhydroxybutyrate depolymerase
MRRFVLAAAALALALTSACAGDDDDSATATTATTAQRGSTTVAPASETVAPRGSSACDADPRAPVETGEAKIMLQSGGVERYYYRFVPRANEGDAPFPVIVDLHGYLEGAEVHKQHSALGPYGDEQGFVTLTPHGPGTDARAPT